jgi:hypothetical protein
MGLSELVPGGYRIFPPFSLQQIPCLMREMFNCGLHRATEILQKRYRQNGDHCS